MKSVLTIIMVAAMLALPMHGMAQDVEGDLAACESLLDEAVGNQMECDGEMVNTRAELAGVKADLAECESRAGWVAIVKDRKVQAAVISVALTLFGGAVTILATP